nr:hypothetical protein Itr_chr06CG18540 [Ipomoea trifida]
MNTPRKRHGLGRRQRKLAAAKLAIFLWKSGWREEDDEPGGFPAHYLTTSEREKDAGEAICDNESMMKCWTALLILYLGPRFFWFFTTDDTKQI